MPDTGNPQDKPLSKRGGRRAGSGRKKGTRNKIPLIIAAVSKGNVAQIRSLIDGDSPGDMLLKIARYHMGRAAKEQKQPSGQRQMMDSKNRPVMVAATDDKLIDRQLELAAKAAAAAAPYVHQRLQSLVLTGADGGPIRVEAINQALSKLPDKDLDTLERILDPLAAATRVTPGIAGSGTTGAAQTKH